MPASPILLKPTNQLRNPETVSHQNDIDTAVNIPCTLSHMGCYVFNFSDSVLLSLSHLLALFCKK